MITTDKLLGRFKTDQYLSLHNGQELLVHRVTRDFNMYDMQDAAAMRGEYLAYEDLLAARVVRPMSKLPKEEAARCMFVPINNGYSRIQVEDLHRRWPHLVELMAIFANIRNKPADMDISPYVMYTHLVAVKDEVYEFPNTTQPVSPNHLFDHALKECHAQLTKPGAVRALDNTTLIYSVALSLRMAQLKWKTNQNVRKKGYTIKSVFDNEPDAIQWSHTIGLSEKFGFEFLIANNRAVTMNAGVLDYIANVQMNHTDIPVEETGEWKYPEEFTPGYVVGGASLRVQFRKVPPQNVVRDLQAWDLRNVNGVYLILMGDKNNLLPGEEGYDETFKQPFFL